MKYFNTVKKVAKLETSSFTEKQLNELISKNKPSKIYHSQWSRKTPFIVITEYNKSGFKMYCNGAADKTPEQHNSKSLYDFLKYQGLSDCYIN